jgi:hypothetical protein
MIRYYGQENVPGAPLSGMRTMEFVPGRDFVGMQQLPYMGGGFGVQQLVGGIPAFQDPRLPMTQDQFQREVEELRFNKKYQTPGSFKQEIRNYVKTNPLGRQAAIPGNFDNKIVS